MNFSLTWPQVLIAAVCLCADLEARAQSNPRVLWTRQGHSDRIAAVGFTPNRAVIATGSWDNTIKLWTSKDGTLLRTLSGHTRRVCSVAFSPDGQLLASMGSDQTLKVWNANSGMLLADISDTARISGFAKSIAFSPDGTLLAATLFNTNGIGLWRVSDFVRVADLQCNRIGTEWIAFSPDGKLLAAAGGYRGLDTTIKVWSVEDRSLIKTIPTSNAYGVRELAFSPDGTLLAAGAEPNSGFVGMTEVWDVSDWSRVAGIPVQARNLAFSPDGTHLVTVRGETAGAGVALDFWRVSGFSRFHSLNSPVPNGNVGPIVFGADRLFVASSTWTNTVNGTLTFGHLSAIFPPSSISSITRTASEMTGRLSGGTGRFQLQKSAELNGDWTNVGEPTTAAQVSIPISRSKEFFRVVDVDP